MPIRPERICGELTKHVPDDAIVVVDTGHAGMWMGGMYDLRLAEQSYIRSAGHLGWAFLRRLGAKAACPDRPVVVFTGDAGFWYHIGELETAVRWNINAVTVVNNNSGGNQSKRGFDRAYGGSRPSRRASCGPSIGIGGMVGAGIFSILGVVAQAAGNAMWLAFAIGGVVALLSTYSYARLGATFPSAGGAVHFLVKSFGDGVFAGGLNLFMWAGYIISLALYAAAFGSYAATFIPPPPPRCW